MNIRKDFVTNSSSSSFVISINKLTAEQLLKLQNFVTVAKELNIPYYDEIQGWDVDITDKEIKGYTSMDDFDFRKFFDAINVDSSIIDWDY